jgi:hypothetical protein
MPLLFDRGRLIEESIIAARVLRCVEAGDRGGLARALEALTVASIERTQPPDAAEDRKDFVDLHPAAAAPLAAFDRIRGRVVRRGPDYWLNSSKRRALKVLAAKAAELRAALGGVAVVQKMRDPATEARDRYIYDRVMAGVPHKDTMKAVNGHVGWRKVGSPEGIKDRAVAYADRHGLTRPKPRRTRGGGSK